MIERKSRDICEKCENFCRSITRDGFPIYCCAIEHNPQRCDDGRIWHKLSTVLYTEPFEDCPYYAEHFVSVASEDINGNLDACHARLGFGKGNSHETLKGVTRR